MSSPEDRARKRRRIQNHKKKDFKPKIRSPQAKALEEPQYRQRVVKDKRGKLHNLDELSHADLIKVINENED